MEAVYLEESLVMFLIINSKGELKQFFEAASCTYLEGAMVETKNSWIFDDDKDGYLNIIMMTDLVDVEYPTENAPNISGIHISLQPLHSKFSSREHFGRPLA